MTRTLIALLLALAVPATTLAREGRKDRHAIRDDLSDVRRVEALLQEFEAAWGNFDRVAARGVDQRVLAALDDELREKSWEARRARRELDRDRRELHEDRWTDPRDVAGDRRELADDRQDFMRAADFANRVQAIRNEWATLRFVTTWPAMNRKHALLEELVKLARIEIREDMQEMREERRP